MFFPQAGGRASIGTTDDNGHYELLYTRSADGAVIGEHTVTISTEVKEDSGYGNEDAAVAGRKEIIPDKYVHKKKTDLTATVTSGSNTIDFNLSSE